MFIDSSIFQRTLSYLSNKRRRVIHRKEHVLYCRNISRTIIIIVENSNKKFWNMRALSLKLQYMFECLWKNFIFWFFCNCRSHKIVILWFLILFNKFSHKISLLFYIFFYCFIFYRIFFLCLYNKTVWTETKKFSSSFFPFDFVGNEKRAQKSNFINKKVDDKRRTLLMMLWGMNLTEGKGWKDKKITTK